MSSEWISRLQNSTYKQHFTSQKSKEKEGTLSLVLMRKNGHFLSFEEKHEDEKQNPIFDRVDQFFHTSLIQFARREKLKGNNKHQNIKYAGIEGGLATFKKIREVKRVQSIESKSIFRHNFALRDMKSKNEDLKTKQCPDIKPIPPIIANKVESPNMIIPKSSKLQLRHTRSFEVKKSILKDRDSTVKPSVPRIDHKVREKERGDKKQRVKVYRSTSPGFRISNKERLGKSMRSQIKLRKLKKTVPLEFTLLPKPSVTKKSKRSLRSPSFAASINRADSYAKERANQTSNDSKKKPVSIPAICKHPRLFRSRRRRINHRGLERKDTYEKLMESSQHEYIAHFAQKYKEKTVRKSREKKTKKLSKKSKRLDLRLHALQSWRDGGKLPGVLDDRSCFFE